MRSLIVLGGLFLAVACASGRDEGFAPNGPSGGFGANDGGDPADDATCAGTAAPTTKAKVDIVFVIDNSSSMKEELDQVRDNINTFVGKIGSSGHDYRVLFIANRTIPNLNKICVPEPLAGPGCADNLPKFRHIDQSVWSNSTLKEIINTYDSPDPKLAWGNFLRNDSFKVFVGISDDGRNDLEPNDFEIKLLAKPGGQFGAAGRRNYVFHAICSWKEGTTPPSTERCQGTDGNGIKYQNLALMTGGLIDSVCKTDYSGVLDKIGSGIVDRLACDLAYPSTLESDPTKVQVRITDPNGTIEKLVPVTDDSKCAANANGWYYDDPNQPTRIQLCAGGCNLANAQKGSKLEAVVGCRGPAPR